MCHNSLSMAFNEDLLGPMSPGGLLECGAGRLAGRRKSAAGSHAKLKASRPLIRVLVINDNGLWINDFI